MKIQLANSCSCSELKVHPATWERKNASIKEDWYIYFRFYDPLFKDSGKYPYLKIIKGMNEYKTLLERQQATKALIQHVHNLLTIYNYNPITNATCTPVDQPIQDAEYIIDPDSAMVTAMESAAKRLDVSPATKININSVMKYYKLAAAQLRFSDVAIKNTRRRHVKLILEQVGKNKGHEIWTANNYNFFRAHLRMIFKELVELDAIEANPVTDLSKKKSVKKIRAVLSEEQISKINTILRADHFRLWRLCHIFANSGSRTTEILQVKKKDIDLDRQMVKYTVFKGSMPREVERPIKDSVKHFWQQVYLEAKDPEQYLFSERLHPGSKPIRREQITRRWRKWVKNKVDVNGIKVYGDNVPDWYALKHLNTDKMQADYGTDIAATLNKHSPAMVNTVYAVGMQGRADEIIKKSKNSLISIDELEILFAEGKKMIETKKPA